MAQPKRNRFGINTAQIHFKRAPRIGHAKHLCFGRGPGISAGPIVVPTPTIPRHRENRVLSAKPKTYKTPDFL